MNVFRGFAFAVAMLLPGVGSAQQGETLADIRSQLSALYIDIQNLRGELASSGTLSTGVQGNTPLDRLNGIEAELQRLTARTEELEFRINRITVDGTNRIGDLEFRLCELEPGCDIGALGDTPSLGGVDNGATVVPPATGTDTGTPALAIGEEGDFRRAQEALATGDFRGAADQLAAFVQTYPGGPLTPQAFFLRGQALEGLGEMQQAGLAYLDAFSSDPSGAQAPRALLGLGKSLVSLGQTVDGCVTLGEVSVRFPTAPEVAEANALRISAGCS